MGIERDVLDLEATVRRLEVALGGPLSQLTVSPVGEMHSTAVVTAFATNWQALALPDAASTFAYYTLFLPPGWGGRTLTMKAMWAPTSTNTGDALWQFVVKSFVSGMTVDATPLSTTTALSAGTGTIALPTTVSSTAALTGLVTGDALQVRIGRVGTDGTDTFTGSALFMALLLSV